MRLTLRSVDDVFADSERVWARIVRVMTSPKHGTVDVHGALDGLDGVGVDGWTESDEDGLDGVMMVAITYKNRNV